MDDQWGRAAISLYLLGLSREDLLWDVASGVVFIASIMQVALIATALCASLVATQPDSSTLLLAAVACSGAVGLLRMLAWDRP